MNVDCTAVSLTAAQAANNLAIILIILVILIAATLYSCLYLSGTLSQLEEKHAQEPTHPDRSIVNRVPQPSNPPTACPTSDVGFKRSNEH